MNSFTKLLLTGALTLSAGLAFAGDSTTTAPTTDDNGGRRLPNGLGIGIFNHNIDTSKIADPALKALVEQFQAARDAIVADRKALMDSLKGLTKEEAKAAIKAWEETHKDAVLAQKDLAKQIRDQLRTLREDRRKKAGTGG